MAARLGPSPHQCCSSSLQAGRQRPHRHRHGHSSSCHPQQRYVAAAGILDSYRREKGLAPPDGVLSGLFGGQKQQQQQQDADADDAPCFVECVQRVDSIEELQAQLDAAGPDALVVVDFYKTACGACKFIQPGFVKLCKAAARSADGDDAPPIVFLKHNVFDDEEEEVTDLAKRYNVRSVPRFIFFKAGREVDNFATRDKDKVAAALLAHAPAGVELGDWNAAE